MNTGLCVFWGEYWHGSGPGHGFGSRPGTPCERGLPQWNIRQSGLTAIITKICFSSWKQDDSGWIQVWSGFSQLLEVCDQFRSLGRPHSALQWSLSTYIQSAERWHLLRGQTQRAFTRFGLRGVSSTVSHHGEEIRGRFWTVQGETAFLYSEQAAVFSLNFRINKSSKCSCKTEHSVRVWPLAAFFFAASAAPCSAEERRYFTPADLYLSVHVNTWLLIHWCWSNTVRVTAFSLCIRIRLPALYPSAG